MALTWEIAMSSNLSPENEQFIENAVSVGMYHDRAEALDRAVELLRRREQLVCDVNEGIEQLERGEGVALDIAAIKTAVRNRLKTP
jgi:Arc/MetJ-type ribon-helix-helix transcriptional regulator